MDKKQLMLELLMPAVFALVSVYVIVKAAAMKGEGVFPMMSAAVLLICSLYLAAEILLKNRAAVNLKGVNLFMVGVTLLVLISYAVLLKRIGYVADTFLLCAAVIRILGYRRIRVTILCSVLAVASTFFVFKVLLSVPLPMLFLDF